MQARQQVFGQSWRVQSPACSLYCRLASKPLLVPCARPLQLRLQVASRHNLKQA